MANTGRPPNVAVMTSQAIAAMSWPHLGSRSLPRSPRTDVAAQPRRVQRPADLTIWLARAFAAAGLALIPWLLVLARYLPASARAWHWPAAWIGLDSLEMLGLLGTGLLLLSRDARYRLTAAATAALLLVDAWFDVITSAPGASQLVAIAPWRPASNCRCPPYAPSWPPAATGQPAPRPITPRLLRQPYASDPGSSAPGSARGGQGTL